MGVRDHQVVQTFRRLMAKKLSRLPVENNAVTKRNSRLFKLKLNFRNLTAIF